MDASNLYLARYTLRMVRYKVYDPAEPTYESSMCIVQANSEQEAMQKVVAKFTVEEPYTLSMRVEDIVITATIV